MKARDVETAAVPRLALTVPTEAAAACGMSAEFFREHVEPGLAVTRLGSKKYVTVTALEQFFTQRGESMAGRLRSAA